MPKSFLRRFCEYAPELKEAIRLMGREDAEFVRDLATAEVTSSAFTVCDAFSEFWAAWHGGQSSYLYSIGSRFCHEFDYSHRNSELDEPGSNVRLFYAFLCVAFKVDDPIRWEMFGQPTPAVSA